MNRPIYHITHLENLEAILRAGKLLAVNRQPLVRRTVAYTHIQERRAKTQVPLDPGGTLHDYVPFYFCPRPPMLYAIHTRFTNYQGGQEPIIHLVSSVQDVVKAGLPFVFTDRHAVLSYASFFNCEQDLSQLDWQAIGALHWAKKEVREKKQAEFLVWDHLPWDLIHKIGVINLKMKRAVLDVLAQFPQRPHPLVTVERQWYY